MLNGEWLVENGELRMENEIPQRGNQEVTALLHFHSAFITHRSALTTRDSSLDFSVPIPAPMVAADLFVYCSCG